MKCTIDCIFAQHLIWNNHKRHIFCGRQTAITKIENEDDCPFFDELKHSINKRELGIEFVGDRSMRNMGCEFE